MMKRRLIGVFLLGVFLAMGSVAQASLIKIGTATYNGVDYNLICDDDNNGKSLVWLDYSAPEAYWGEQMAWASSLDAALTYNLDSGYTVQSGSWRLPSAGDAPAYGFGANTQELGHLYYDELGFTGGSSNDGVTAPDLASAAGLFDNLQLSGYWTSTEDDPVWGTPTAWMFAFRETRSTPYNDTVYGFQDIDWSGTNWLSVKHSALAVFDGEVTSTSTGTVIPEPATISLLGLGIAALVARRRRK